MVMAVLKQGLVSLDTLHQPVTGWDMMVYILNLIMSYHSMFDFQRVLLVPFLHCSQVFDCY